MKTDRAFWDTSAIVPLCCHQETSAQLRQIMRDLKRVVVWWGTSVETHSALSRLARDGRISPQGMRQAIARLDVLRAGWSEILPGEQVRRIAEMLPAQHGLRALDSLQLAAALIWCREKPRGRLLVCCDERLAAVAAKIGFNLLP